ncbi:MAG: ABC transporter permease subunit [Acidimicrobiia bacterium]
MLGDIWTKTLWDQRRSLLGWAIGFAAVSLVYGGFYPFAATPEYAELIESLPPALADAMGWGDISTPHGYLGATVFGILGPVLAIIMSIGLGTRAIAGSEEDGSLEMLIAHPVTRTTVVVQKAIALAVATVMAGAVVLVAILMIRGPIELDIAFTHIAAASLDLALMGLLFGSLAILVGGITGRRGLAISVSAAVVVIAYLANGLAPQVGALAWLQNLSPFHWADGTSTLRDGIDPLNTLLLGGVAAVLIAGAAFAFNRRDVGV